jgi:hypothetical protein
LLERGIFDGFLDFDAGRIDQDIELTPLLCQFTESRRNHVFTGDIEFYEFDSRRQSSRIPQVGSDNAGALGGKTRTDGRTDSTATTRYKGSFTL